MTDKDTKMGRRKFLATVTAAFGALVLQAHHRPGHPIPPGHQTTTTTSTTTSTTQPTTTTTQPTTTTTQPPVTTTTTVPPGGTMIRQGDPILSMVNGASPGQVFYVEPGAVFDLSGTLQPPSGVKVLGDPENPFVLDGGNRVHTAINGSGQDVEIGGIEVRNYGTQVTEDYNFVVGRTTEALYMHSMNGVHLHDFYVHHLDGGIKVPSGALIERGVAEYCKHMSITANGRSGFEVKDFIHRYANVKQNGGYYFDDSWEASVKFVACHDLLFENWLGEFNHGPGWWADGGNYNYVLRNIKTFDNSESGIFWEINEGSFLLDGFETARNAGASNLHISDSRGSSASNPIVARNGLSYDHIRPPNNGWAVGLTAAGRGPGLANVRLENITVDELPIRLYDLVGLSQATLDTIQAVGCQRTDGTPVGISYYRG